MRKNSISVALASIFFGMPMVANAAYPAYPTYQTQQRVTNNQQIVYQQPTQAVNYQQQPQVVNARTTVAANPTRVTGSLPRVGSASTNAGRQYYQPENYDRLADSGLYIGLAVGYSVAINGGIMADYQNEKNASFVPGAFEKATFASDTVIPLQLSVGASLNNDFRVDFSYLRYSGIEYPSNVQASNGIGGFVTTQVTGGAITANATMLNVYYNLDSYTGYLAGGMLRPYIGVGLGISLNTIADYVVFDGSFYDVMLPADANAGQLTGISDIYAYHNGGTSEQLAYMIEGGITTELDGGIKLDFFVRYSGLGKIKTSGSIVVSQTEWLGDGAGGEYEGNYDSVFHYTNWYESGNLSTIDLGVRLRLQF